eukprot:scaffold120_cov176-Alexandrium_tamarense.AAC.6
MCGKWPYDCQSSVASNTASPSPLSSPRRFDRPSLQFQYLLYHQGNCFVRSESSFVAVDG